MIVSAFCAQHSALFTKHCIPHNLHNTFNFGQVRPSRINEFLISPLAFSYKQARNGNIRIRGWPTYSIHIFHVAASRKQKHLTSKPFIPLWGTKLFVATRRLLKRQRNRNSSMYDVLRGSGFFLASLCAREKATFCGAEGLLKKFRNIWILRRRNLNLNKYIFEMQLGLGFSTRSIVQKFQVKCYLC